MTVRTVAVVGAGQMGAGIAQVAAQSGYRVLLHDVNELLLDRGLDAVRQSLARLAQRGKLPAAEAPTILARITPTLALEECAQTDFVIEAIVERADAKKDLFRALDRTAPASTIYASNTSSIPITDLAAATSRPGRFIGMHFMNPVPLMPLLEVIRGLETSDDTARTALEVGQRMGKTPVEVVDSPGFLVNRLLLPFINEAFYALLEGIAKPEDIDRCAKLGLNHPMGPLELADFVGLDTCLYVLEVMHAELGDPKFRPCPLLRKYVQAGRLGRKSGRGVYEYGSA